ncbi:MAG: histone [Candidatus Hodarchaeales archaeon]
MPHHLLAIIRKSRGTVNYKHAKRYLRSGGQAFVSGRGITSLERDWAAYHTMKRQERTMAGGFARARVEKLIRTAGAWRVSADATNKLNEILTERGMSIAKYAVELARHSGRKTIKAGDITLSAEK